MKKTIWVGMCLLGMMIYQSASFGTEHKQLKAYPAAKHGMQRIVITLPEKNDHEAANFKIELVAGKQLLSNGINRLRLATSIVRKTLTGWGYSYYEVTGSDSMASTMMAVPKGNKKVKTFVAGSPLMIPYNSRLPVVIYAPKEYEIRYRIWHTSGRLSANLTGSWVQPVKGNSTEKQGFTLFADGSAASINMATLLYQQWKISNASITLTVESLGNHTHSESIETYAYETPDANTLILKKGSWSQEYKRLISDKHP
ncbi:MAG: ecotin family protein [Mariprofundus sp.]